MKKRYKLMMVLAVAVVTCVGIRKPSNTLSIFSWENKQLNLSNIDTMEKYLKQLNINTIYQNIDEYNNEKISEFVKVLKNKGIDTYALTGEPSWYEDNSYIKSYLNRINDYNKEVKDKYRIKGIVLDIEPWTVYENWDRKAYAKSMEEAYQYAQNLNIKFIMVIPTWLEPSELDIIIKNCDKVAVMNYNIDLPVENIKEEIFIAKKHNKYIDIIAEVQPANEEYGVEKNTTYYYESHERLLKDWKVIKEVYKYNKIDFSYHDYKNIKEFMKLGE